MSNDPDDHLAGSCEAPTVRHFPFNSAGDGGDASKAKEEMNLASIGNS